MNKAFTLIELLAVIILLAVISLIATPSMINVINTAKDKADLESVYGILDSARLYYSESMMDNDKKSNIDNLNDIYSDVSLLNKPDNGHLYINEKGLIALSVVIRNKCYTKQFSGKIVISNDIDNCTLGYIGIDTEAPTVSFNVAEGTFNTNGWAKNNFNVNITISDSQSGASSYKYCIDTTACTPTVEVNNTTGFSEISTNSETNKVCVIGIDNYGNESDTICSDNYKLDSITPTLTAITDDVTITEGDSYQVSNYFNIPTYGISGGTLICTPENTSSLSIGTQTVSCTATSNSGLLTVTEKTITVNAAGPYIASEGVNDPQLTTGMTPIKWVDGVETETTVDDSDWYDYSNKLWANAKTADGSYWVWIPRYAYKISSGWHTNSAGTIDIIFLKNDTTDNSSATTIYTSGYSSTGTNTSNAYFLEPAFDSNTKYGFWVAKFEMSNTTTLPKSVPNISSLRGITIGNMFTYSQNMASNTSYGWTSGTIDTHMMTNYEWGAVAYLSWSTYGKNSTVEKNNSSTYITGCSGTSSKYSGCESSYDTTTGQQASTTGNITGIYDMNGGSFEYVAAYFNNSYASNYGSSIVNASTKNKNVYTTTYDANITNYSSIANMYGDAIYETSNSYEGTNSWNGRASYIPYSSTPWFIRGGEFYTMNGIFSFIYYNGSENAVNTTEYNGGSASFRVIVLNLN